jgi:hypothetical protein
MRGKGGDNNKGTVGGIGGEMKVEGERRKGL